MLATGGSLTRTGGHGHWWGVEADSADEIRKAVRNQSKSGADSLKVMVDGGIDLGRTSLGLLYFDEKALGPGVCEARDWGLDVVAHCLTAAGVRSAVDAGVTSIEHGIFYEHDIDDSRYGPDVGRRIADKGIYVAPGPAFAYEVFAAPERRRPGRETRACSTSVSKIRLRCASRGSRSSRAPMPTNRLWLG